MIYLAIAGLAAIPLMLGGFLVWVLLTEPSTGEGRPG